MEELEAAQDIFQGDIAKARERLASLEEAVVAEDMAGMASNQKLKTDVAVAKETVTLLEKELEALAEELVTKGNETKD